MALHPKATRIPYPVLCVCVDLHRTKNALWPLALITVIPVFTSCHTHTKGQAHTRQVKIAFTTTHNVFIVCIISIIYQQCFSFLFLFLFFFLIFRPKTFSSINRPVCTNQSENVVVNLLLSG